MWRSLMLSYNIPSVHSNKVGGGGGGGGGVTFKICKNYGRHF